MVVARYLVVGRRGGREKFGAERGGKGRMVGGDTASWWLSIWWLVGEGGGESETVKQNLESLKH
jgi:hypothetical protein